MTSSPVPDEQIRGLLEEVAREAPLPGDLSATTLRLGRRRRTLRRAAGATGLAVGAVFGLSAVVVAFRPEPVTTVPATGPAAERLDCGDSGVNVGAPDGADGQGSPDKPLDQARRWLDGSGVGARYPGWSARADAGPVTGQTTVTVQDATGAPRAVLVYSRGGDGWSLTEVASC